MELKTVPVYLLHQAEIQGSSRALSYWEEDEWKSYTWGEYAAEVKQAGRALMVLGLQLGGKVCILGFNRPEWVIMDLATMLAGGVPAGIYETCSSESVAYIIEHSEASMILVENSIQLDKVLNRIESLPHLKYIVMMKGMVDQHPMTMTWREFLQKGDELEEKKLMERQESLDEDAVATLIYTSGTTGPPKAVMLSHKNLVWTASQAIDMLGINDGDTGFSYLPLSHIAEQMFTIHAPNIGGWPVTFAKSRESVLENLKEWQPTIIFGVPRVWEKFQAGVAAKLHQATGVKKFLVNFARRTASAVHTIQNAGGKSRGWLAIKYKLAKKLVLDKVKTALGMGNARICVSGAAPITPEILEFFASLDILILEVYGQSEDSGPTSFNRPGQVKFGSVGPPYPGDDVKIADDGEILVRGDNVFKGYYKDPDATAETLKDGWLYSGDLGEIDEDGFLWITGRKKEIIVTSGGKNIAPANIEGMLKNIPLVSQAIVIGDKRKFLSALITLDVEASTVFAQEKSLPEENLYKDEVVRMEIQLAIEEVNSHLARVENIRKFEILPRDLTVDDGELTPTLKLVRHIIAKNWSTTIEEIYAE